jgi:hypothetical protein
VIKFGIVDTVYIVRDDSGVIYDVFHSSMAAQTYIGQQLTENGITVLRVDKRSVRDLYEHKEWDGSRD